MRQQSRDSIETERRPDIGIHIWPRRQLLRRQSREPFLTWMTFHSDAQCATLSSCTIRKNAFGMVELRQYAPRHGEQIFPSVSRAQATPFLCPHLYAVVFFALAHHVRNRRLGKVRSCGRRGDAI